VQYAEGSVDSAVETMVAAAERTWPGGGPGDLLPASEQLGDMYLELERYGEALTAYQATLSRIPNRFNSLCGAARAAELGGDHDGARAYRATLAAVAKDSQRACAPVTETDI
jgi:tetratricopeptide (TPR) repeat protein